MPGEIALDSSVVVDLLDGNRIFIGKITDYNIIYLPAPVIGELLYGAFISSQVEKNIEQIYALSSKSEIIPCDLEAAEYFSIIKTSLKKSGKLIPDMDIMIAACCLKQNVPLATQDKHFEFIENFKIERW